MSTHYFRKLFRLPKSPADFARALIIGEVAQSHDGSLGLAHSFVDAIADAGADAVKFQTHIAAAESTPSEPWRVKFSRQDSTRFDYWKRMEFTEDQWRGLREHADDRGILFLSSPFSVEAIELLERMGVPAWKVASGETCNLPLLDRMAATGIPMMLSTGMSSIDEIDAAVELLRSRNIPIAVMQCSSMYPCPPEKIGLNIITEMRDRHECAVGLSDHSGTIFPSLAAATIGVDVLEVHVALSREMFGPDVPVSVTSAELRQLVEGVRFIERMIANPVAKDDMALETSPLRSLFTKSLVARIDLATGTVLNEEHLAAKKPGTGIPAARIHEVIGRELRRDLKADEMIGQDDLLRVNR